jgi:hypothetical protein
LTFDRRSEIFVEVENNQDIATYVRHELKDSESQLTDVIISGARGVFLWAFLIIKQVSNLKREGKTSKRIETAIQEIPQELDELCRELLANISKKKRPMSLKLIQWICFAIRPLSLDELRFAIVIDADTKYTSLRQCQESEGYTDNSEEMEKKVKHLSCGLIEIQLRDKTRIAQFVHQSISDFFLQGGLQILDDSWKSAELAIGNAHYRLAKSCIRYIAMEEIGEFETGNWWEHKSKISNFPFLEYATTAWSKHSERAEAQNTPQVDLLDYWHWPSNDLLQRWTHVYRAIDKYSEECPLKNTTLLHILSRYNLISPLSAILETFDNVGIKADSKDMIGATALHWAARNGHETVVSLLINVMDNIDMGDFDGGTPLAWAIECRSEAVIQLLLAENPKVNFEYIPFVSEPGF